MKAFEELITGLPGWTTNVIVLTGAANRFVLLALGPSMEDVVGLTAHDSWDELIKVRDLLNAHLKLTSP